MATKRKTSTTKKTTEAVPDIKEEAVATVEVTTTEPVKEEISTEVKEEVKVEESVKEEEKKEEQTVVEEAPAPVEEKKPTTKSKSSSTKKVDTEKTEVNPFVEKENKFRKMAEKIGIILPKYSYTEEDINTTNLRGTSLTGAEIIHQVIMGNIVIDDFKMKNINPNSYNLTLDNVLKTYNPVYRNPNNPNDTRQYLDILKENPYNTYEIPESGFALLPGTLYIASTKERVFTNKFIPEIGGRSSIGRLGVTIHVTAGYGDIGFDGKWTLEIVVVHPIIIYPNIPICQIDFRPPCGDTCIQYKGRYQHQDTAETSKFYLK